MNEQEIAKDHKDFLKRQKDKEWQECQNRRNQVGACQKTCPRYGKETCLKKMELKTQKHFIPSRY